MGRPKNMSTKQFLEDNEEKQKQKSALEAANAGKPKKTMEDLKKEADEEMKMIENERQLEQERAYKRMEYWDNTAREEGIGGKKAAGIIPAA